MKDNFSDLRAAIYSTPEELRHFRQLMVNMVLATDIMDKDLGALRKQRWTKVFEDDVMEESPTINSEEDLNRKATIVLEYLIQASDVAHTSKLLPPQFSVFPYVCFTHKPIPYKIVSATLEYLLEMERTLLLRMLR